MEHEGEYLLAEVLLAVLPVLAAVHEDVELPTVRYLYKNLGYCQDKLLLLGSFLECACRSQ